MNTGFELLYFFIFVNICTEKNAVTQRKFLLTQSFSTCFHLCISQNTLVIKVIFCSLIMNPKPFANSHLCVALTPWYYFCVVH